MEVKLEMIEGNRDELEREALEAIFTDSEKAAVLLERLKKTPSSQLTLIKNETD